MCMNCWYPLTHHLYLHHSGLKCLNCSWCVWCLHCEPSPPSTSSSLPLLHVCPPLHRLSLCIHHLFVWSLLSSLCFLLSFFHLFVFPHLSSLFLLFPLHPCLISSSIFLLPSPPSSSCPSSITVHTLTLVVLSFVPPSPGSQRWSAAHLEPRGGSESHASGRTWGSSCPRFSPPVPLPQPPHPPPHGDRFHGDSHHASHGTGKWRQQQWVRPEASVLPLSTPWRQWPHEPDLVPWGLGVSLLKPRLVLFLQWSLTAAPGRGHGRVIPDWQPKYPIRRTRRRKRRKQSVKGALRI